MTKIKRELHLNAIKESGLKIGFIANKIGVNRNMLSRWLHNAEGSKINLDQVERLEKLLKM